VAHSLVAKGIPAVVFKKFAATDESATTLAHELYANVARGSSVDAALAEARKATFAQGHEVEWGAPILYMRAPDGRIFNLEQTSVDDQPDATTNVKRSRLFISYKRDVEPDEPLALKLYQELKQKHDVFIDQALPVGTRWAERIEEELKQTDFLIVLLSAESIHSELVQLEITTAHQLAKKQNGRPAILPVRLNYREPFPYPINAYLDPIEWAYWKGAEDTSRLLEELNRAISGGVLSISDPKSKASRVIPN